MSKKLFLLPALLGAFMLMFSACDPADPCKDVDCGANGTCFEGECVCDEGYEGVACADEWATKFLGSYLGNDVCGGTTYTLTKPAVVTKKTVSSVSISNFGGFDSFIDANIQRATASAATADELDINFTDPAGRKFLGTATINGSTLSGTYRVTYSDNTFEDCTFTYTK